MAEINYKKIYCSRFLLDLKLCSLENYFAPLATHSEIPILAGETLYPSVEHYVAAQLFRDVGRLEAAAIVPQIKLQQDLRLYIRKTLIGIDENLINDWRHTKMLSALKTATQLKFSQYSELKALLVQTGNAILVETSENDLDWGIGMNFQTLNKWMESESLSTLSVAFWLMHCDFKPGILGANLTGRLLMTLRNEMLAELDKDIKPEIDNDVYHCQLCSNFQSINSMIELDMDEIICINAPNSVLEFNCPSIFYDESEIFTSVDDFACRKISELISACQSGSNLTEDVIENEVFRIYEKGIRLNLSQNAFAREALIRSKNAVLVDVRPSVRRNFQLNRRFAVNLGAFYGNLHEFQRYVDRNSLSAQTLARWWLTDFAPRLKSVGKNRFGLLLMNLRQKLLSGSDDEDLKKFSITDEEFRRKCPRTTTIDENFDGFLFKTNNFVTTDKITFLTDDKRNPLLKYYPGLFSVDNTDFITLEHYVWWRRLENITSSEFLRRILCTNDATELKEMCEMWLSSNTPVVDEDRTPDWKIFEKGCSAKFDQNCSLAAYLASDLNLLVAGTNEELDVLKKTIARWGVPTKLLLCWWLDVDYQKPSWLTDNFFGFTLMKTRQKLIDAYFTDLIAPDVKLIELMTDDLESISSDEEDDNNTSFYVFSNDDLLSLHSHKNGFTKDSVAYSSIAHFYWSTCLRELDLTVESNTILAIENNECAEKVFENLLKTANCIDKFRQWRSENEEKTLKCGVVACCETNSEFLQLLSATERLCLIFAAENSEYGVGMTRETFTEFVNDFELDPDSFLKLSRDVSCKPECLGRNVWANVLMDCGTELKDSKLNETKNTSLIIDDNILKLEKDRSKKIFLEQSLADSSIVTKTDDNVATWDDLSNYFVNQIKEEVDDSQVPSGKMKTNFESSLDKKRLALLTAFRQCYPTFADLMSTVKNEDDAYILGQKFASVFERTFDDKFEQAVNTFSFQDLHGLGRVTGFEQNYP